MSLLQAFNIPRNLAIEYFTEEFSNNMLRMGRDCDTKSPEYLTIELSEGLDQENFKNICHKICFEMSIGGQIILSIPLRFMMNLKEYEIYDNTFSITIPFEMFCDDIRVVALHHHEIWFTLTNTENNFRSCKLISKGVFYDTNLRMPMARDPHEHIIQCLASTEILCTNFLNGNEFQINQFNYNMNFNGLHKGFFIESENVDQINEISLSLNGAQRFLYNRFLVRTKCIKINQHLLYLPFNYDKSYTDRTPVGFEGALTLDIDVTNLNRIDVSKLNIKLDCPQSKICIYGLGSTMLRYINGMAGLAYDNSNIIHEHKEYIESGIYHQTTPFPLETQTPTVPNFFDTDPGFELRLLPTIHSNTDIEYIYRPITNNNKLTCSITQCEFDINDRYMSCVQCSNNYMEESIKNWFIHRPDRKSCPMCRTNWTDFNVYINGQMNEQMNEQMNGQMNEDIIVESIDEPIDEYIEPMNQYGESMNEPMNEDIEPTNDPMIEPMNESMDEDGESTDEDIAEPPQIIARRNYLYRFF
jgi:hypothetical protein